jgi:hypothetical protein
LRNWPKGQLRINNYATQVRAIIICPVISENSKADIYLGGCKANAGRFIHSFVHVFDQASKLVVKLGNFGGALVKDRISLDANWSNGHPINLPEASVGFGSW